jgi:hypothetical protein
MKDLIEFKWDLLGAKLGSLSDEEQSAFFKGFAKELDSFESNYYKQIQMTSVKKLLDKKTKDVLKKYFPSLWDE